VIAERTGLGRVWVGVALMGTITSLPELATGLSSVLVFDAPDIAAGDVLGSCMANLLILVLLDALCKGPLLAQVHTGHVLTGAFGVLLLGVVLASVFVGPRQAALGWMSPSSLLVLLLYFLAMRALFFYEQRAMAALKRLKLYPEQSLREAVRGYVLNALVVVAAATALPYLGKTLAEATGLGQTFMGSIFIAVSTSLPELVVSLAALRLQALDLAVGNLLGSNLFNMGILAVDDFFYFQGPLMSAIEQGHVLTALTAMMMTAVVITGITYRAQQKRRPLAWDSMSLLMLYLVNMLALYALRG
jgi:cation:H+ antiporter